MQDWAQTLAALVQEAESLLRMIVARWLKMQMRMAAAGELNWTDRYGKCRSAGRGWKKWWQVGRRLE